MGGGAEVQRVEVVTHPAGFRLNGQPLKQLQQLSVIHVALRVLHLTNQLVDSLLIQVEPFDELLHLLVEFELLAIVNYAGECDDGRLVRCEP